MKNHSPPIGSFLRSALALVAIAFIAGTANAAPVANKSVLKAVPEKLIADTNVNDSTLKVTDAGVSISLIEADTFVAIAPNNDNAITPNKVLMVNKNITATAATTRVNVRAKETVECPAGASQTVALANSFAANPANTDAWAADSPAITATG